MISAGHQYALDVLADPSPYVTGENVKGACRRFLRDLETAAARGLVFDAAAAAHAVDAFERCVHTKGKWAGQPIHLEPWERFIVENAYGWLWLATGLRRFRIIYIRVARKQGKTTLAYPSGIYALALDGEEGAEVYAAATTRPQASIVWDVACRGIQLMGPEAFADVTLQKRVDGLYALESASKFQPLASDSRKLDGLNPSHAIVDELHEHPDGALWSIIETGMGAREQPMMWGLTTAGETEESFCGELDARASQIVRGIAEDDRFFAYIAAPDDGDDWTAPDTWRKANPNLGVTVKLEDLVHDCQEAIERPIKQVPFRRYRCNQWVAARSAYISLPVWDACTHGVTPDEIARLRLGEVGYVGVDISQHKDLTALSMLFPPTAENPFWDVLWKCWVPEDQIENTSGDEQQRLRTWRETGELYVCPGPAIDQYQILAGLEAWAGEYAIERVGYDPWGAVAFARDVEEAGLLAVEVRQGTKTMSEPTKQLDVLVSTGKLRHGGHSLARWCISNLSVVFDDGGNVKPEKKGGKGGTSRKRIDPIVATIIALEEAMRGEADVTPPSVYATGDLMVLDL